MGNALALLAICLAVIGMVLPVPPSVPPPPATYSQDFAPKVTGLFTSNQNLIRNQAYCLGLDAGPFSPLVSGDYIQGLATAAASSVNVTNQQFNFIIYLGANGIVPSHTFAQGFCASHTGALLSPMSLVAVVTGISFTATRAFATTRPTGTYWVWVEITAVTTDVKATLVESTAGEISLRDASKVGPSP